MKTLIFAALSALCSCSPPPEAAPIERPVLAAAPGVGPTAAWCYEDRQRCIFWCFADPITAPWCLVKCDESFWACIAAVSPPGPRPLPEPIGVF